MPPHHALLPALPLLAALLAALLTPLPALAQNAGRLSVVEEERWVGRAEVWAQAGVTAAVCDFGDEPPAPRPWQDDLPADEAGAGEDGEAGAGSDAPPPAAPFAEMSVPALRVRLLDGLVAAGASGAQLRRVVGRFDAAVAARRRMEVALAAVPEALPTYRYGGVFGTDGCSPAFYRRLRAMLR